MRSSDFLFQLIKSLSKGERRNFKLFSRLQDGDKNYALLFEAIDQQEEYDEKNILKEFEGEKFTRQFSVAKNYLYKFILRTLHIFDKGPDAELRILLHQAEILLEKNLFPHAEKLLRKVVHLAEKRERFEELLQVMRFRRRILIQSSRMKEFEAFASDIQEIEIRVLAKITNLQAYQHLADEIYLEKERAEVARGSKELSTFEKVLQSPLMQDEDQALSIRAQIKRTLILEDCYRFAQDFENCLVSVKNAISLFQKHPFIRQEVTLKYIHSLTNCAVYHFIKSDFEEGKKYLETLINVDPKNEQERLAIFERYYSLKISLCMDAGDIPEGRKVVKNFALEFENLQGQLQKSYQFMLFHRIAYFWMIAGEFSEALVWINKILNEPKTEMKTDIQCSARIMNLIAHYELGNKELVEYNCKSTYRFIYKRNRMFAFERISLKYLKKLATSFDSESERAILTSFKTDLTEALKDPFEASGLELFDIDMWIDSKLEGIKTWQIRAQEFQEKIEVK